MVRPMISLCCQDLLGGCQSLLPSCQGRLLRLQIFSWFVRTFSWLLRKPWEPFFFVRDLGKWIGLEVGEDIGLGLSCDVCCKS